MKKKTLLLALLLCLFTFTACGKGEEKKAENGKPAAESGEASLDKDQYYMGHIGAEPVTLDAQVGQDSYSKNIISNVYEPLVQIHEVEENKLEVEPAGAESYDVSDDGLVYTFHLRDFEWEDGQAVTAGDYEYGIKRAADPDTAAQAAFLLDPIKNFKAVNSGEMAVDELGVKAVDDKTLEITLEAPAEYFIKIVPYRVMYPQRKDMVEKYGDSFGSSTDGIISCGPFKVTDWTHNSEVNLVKNDTYWNKDNIKLEKINYRILNDINTVGNAFDVGEIDSMSTSIKEWTDKLDDKEGVHWYPFIRPTLDFMTINTENKLMSNKKIRQAIQVGLDRDGLNKQVYSGVNTDCTGWVPPTINLGEKPYSEQIGFKPLDDLIDSVDDPKELFIEGLKELGMDPDPSKVTLEYKVSNTADLKGANEYIQANLKEALGVNVDIVTLEWPVLSNAMDKGDFQISYSAWSTDYDDPYAMLSMFLTDAGVITTNWSNPEYDKLVKEASETTDTKEAAEKYGEAEKILIEESPVIPIANVTHHKFRYDYLKGLPVSELDTTGLRYVYTSGRN
ncbi:MULTISPECIES: peptide ABC transporter substrate-binding protein [Peptoniphilus]|jgi:dipeptide ABC superfamily ATP binding cassette transporter, binding protein|uniref:peptide ABC transporter substrate-binding protein n=1 Tax=Peptoniphilus TaxID=162289 RepID=UPI0002884444|nr:MULTISPECIES: peptide ABC transporter substrate-binding protein [Peptoniphilus]MBS6610601.1 peptide ABC transporter substrate-binding protein [Peptoniphilus harei]MDU1043856.1 peptide ABC transporter substrate-binding protein [Peptoniphilus rhinitidis]MDU1954651.1 peptide ABC transporter substrate-binding protein [Peptoniphilus lacydonensis]MDU2110596.1 peptide ABC transporter substrate-binding protein [Peptoniphilus lacydonensis]MDU2115799.1 peptide ABC transporter substrate-binding protei